MTNPNDLISKKEVDRLIDEMIERGKSNNDILRYGNTVLRNLEKEISQIESVNGWIPVVPSDIWSNEYAYVMVTDWVKIWPAYYDTHQWFFWHDNDLPVDPTLVKLDSFKHNLPPTNKV